MGPRGIFFLRQGSGRKPGSLFANLGHPAAEVVPERLVFPVTKFASIEIDAAALGALLVADVGLFVVGNMIKSGATERTVDYIDFVLFATDLGIALVDDLGLETVFKVLYIAGFEPDAMTVHAASQ